MSSEQAAADARKAILAKADQLSLPEIRALLDQLGATGGVEPVGAKRTDANPVDASPVHANRESKRVRRRRTRAIYRLRVDLNRSDPAIWRRLEVHSDLHLDVLHQVLQEAFEWTDSHLHRFTLGGDSFDSNAEHFLCPFDVEDGEEYGIPAYQVRLDEALNQPGDELLYLYDYGDNWDVTIRLEEVLNSEPGTPLAQCTDGRRAAPPEDSGSRRTAEELAEVVDSPAAFDVATINAALAGPHFTLLAAGINPQLMLVTARLTTTPSYPQIAARMSELANPRPTLDPEVRNAALAPHLWFLQRAEGDGIELTSAGYLKPTDVEAASAILPAMNSWQGQRNREINAFPLLRFRESLQHLGLLRKRKNRLLLTKAGTESLADPARLWSHLADRIRANKPGSFEHDATLLILLFAATESGGLLHLTPIAQALGDHGWRTESQTLPTTAILRNLPVLDVLDNLTSPTEARSNRCVLTEASVAMARDSLHVE